MKAFLLDLDGTLVDDSLAEMQGQKAFYEHFSSQLHGWSFELFTQRWNQASSRNWERFTRKELSFQGQRRERVREVLGATLSDPESDQAFEVFLQSYEESWTLYPDATEWLERFAGHPLAIVTNGESAHQCHKAAKVGLGRLFPYVVTPELAGAWKPSPAMFTYAARLLNVTPSDCTMIGDDLVKDILPALELGMNALWVNRLNRQLPSGITRPIAQVANLRECLL